MLAACNGETPEGWGAIKGAEAQLCDSMILGIAEAAAAIGRNRPGSKFCVSREFSIEAFKKTVLRLLNDTSLSDATQKEMLTEHLVADGDGERDCSWLGLVSIQQLGEDCRWFQLSNAADQQDLARDLALRSGARSESELRRIVVDAIVNCVGYFGGYLVTSIISREVDSKPAYCLDHGEFGPESDKPAPVGFDKVSRVVVRTMETHPEEAKDPVGQHVYDLVVKAFPCRSPDPAPLAQAAHAKRWHLRNLVASACRDDPSFERAYQFFLPEAYCGMFLAGLVEGYASARGMEAGRAACLPGGLNATKLRSSIRDKITAPSFTIGLEAVLDRETGRQQSEAVPCRWQGRELARKAVTSCLRLVRGKRVDHDTAMTAGRLLYQDFFIQGQDLDDAARRDFGGCIGYIQGLVFTASQPATDGAKAAACLPDHEKWEGTALLISLDVWDKVNGETLKPDAPVASVAFESAIKRAPCAAPAIN